VFPLPTENGDIEAIETTNVTCRHGLRLLVETVYRWGMARLRVDDDPVFEDSYRVSVTVSPSSPKEIPQKAISWPKVASRAEADEAHFDAVCTVMGGDCLGFHA